MHNPAHSRLARTHPAQAPTHGFEDWWQRIQPILNSAADFCTVIDTDFVYRAVNNSYCQAHGRTRTEIIGRTVASLWGENVFQSILRPPLERCFRGEEVRYHAHFGFPKTNPRHYEVSLYPYVTQSGGHSSTQAIVITRDVTALYEAEEEARLVLLLARAINQARDFDTALAQVVREVCRFTGWTLGQAWLSVPGENGFKCAPFCETMRPGLEAFYALSRQKQWRQEEVLAGTAWEAGQPVWAPEFSEDTQHARSPLARELGLTAAMAIPVRAGGKVVAVMEFLLATPRAKDRRLMGVVSAVTKQLDSLFLRKRTEQAVTLSEEHYRKLFHQAYKTQENLQRLSDRILQIQEQERARISRDLHDEVGQALTAINVNLAVLGKALASAPQEVVRRLADARAQLEQTMETVHDFSRELRPAMLDDLGLVPALRSYIKSCAARTGLAVDFRASHEEQIEQLAAEQKIVLYRVAQEGLNNAVKHAQANRVVVEAGESEGRVSLTIIDDGHGFVVNGQADETPGRLGLLGIAERVRLVNGEFSVQSSPGRGTTLRVTVPLPPV